MAKKKTAKRKAATPRTTQETPGAIADQMAPGQNVSRQAMKRAKIRVREFQRVQPDGQDDLRVWMVVGLQNMLQPWLGSTLDGDQIAELIQRANVDVEFTLDQ